MASHELAVQSRQETGKAAARRLRREGQIPAVAYGQGGEPQKLTVNAREMRDLLAHHFSRGLLTLKFQDGSPDLPVIIKELQRHPVRHTVNAVDFLRVSLSEEVEANVRVVLVGEPEGVKRDGGVLVHALHELHVSALPQNLPEQIEADVSQLEMEGAPLHVSDLPLPHGIRVLTAGDETVAVVNAPRAEEVAPASEETSAAEVPLVGAEESTEE